MSHLRCETFVGSKKSNSGFIAVNSKAAGIVKSVVGDRSLATFRLLWLMIQGWCCCLYITDGYPVYACIIDMNLWNFVSHLAWRRSYGFF